MLFFFVYLQKDNYIKHNEILNQRKSIISFWKDVMKLYLMYYRDSILTNKKSLVSYKVTVLYGINCYKLHLINIKIIRHRERK